MKVHSTPSWLVKAGVDAVSLTTIGATLVGWAPSAAAVLAVVWSAIRIVETKTFRWLLGWDKNPRFGGRGPFTPTD
jgi:hypothetical protein